MVGDMPSLAKSSRSTMSYGLGDLSAGSPFAGTAASSIFNANSSIFNANNLGGLMGAQQQSALTRTVSERRLSIDNGGAVKGKIISSKEPKVTRRLVQVFIADPDEQVPLEDAVLYSGEQKLTDLTDQELFFEIDIKGVLASHNDKRVKIINKKVKERTEFLDPIKVRDLKMVVVDVASF